MQFSSGHPKARATSAIGFTIRGTLTLYGRSLPQTQYLTERYVVTQVDRATFIFLADRRERFLIDRAADRLRRIEPNPRTIRADRLRAVIGDIEVRLVDEAVEVGGYWCRRYRFENENARIVISGETLVTRLNGLEQTALQAERDHDGLNQPFTLPLESGDLVVESSLRTIAVDFEQNQAYRLETVETKIEQTAEIDRLARLAIIG